MKTVRTYLIIAIGLLMISALPGFAQQRRWLSMNPSYDLLGLTSEQIDQIEEMELQFQKEILDLETELNSQYLELRRMIAQNEKQANIDAKFDKIDQMELSLDQKYQTQQMKIRDLLTEEQKLLFDREGGLGMGIDLGYDRGYDLGYGRGYAPGYGRGYVPGYGRGYGRFYGRGFGPGLGRGYGPGYGRGYAPGCGRGYGRGYGLYSYRDYGWNYDRRYTPYYNRGYGRDYGIRYGWGLGRGFGRGWGRGYWCPWRWR